MAPAGPAFVVPGGSPLTMRPPRRAAGLNQVPQMCAANKFASVAAAALLLVAPSPGHAQMDREVLIFDHDQGLAGADFSNRKDLVGAIFSKANAKVWETYAFIFSVGLCMRPFGSSFPDVTLEPPLLSFLA